MYLSAFINLSLASRFLKNSSLARQDSMLSNYSPPIPKIEIKRISSEEVRITGVLSAMFCPWQSEHLRLSMAEQMDAFACSILYLCLVTLMFTVSLHGRGGEHILCGYSC